MIQRTVISLISAGLIILTIPIMFFTVGHWVEVRITKRETKRYIDTICETPFFTKDMLILVNNRLKESSNTSMDDAILRENRDIRYKSFVMCIGLSLILCCIGIILALYKNVDYIPVLYNTVSGVGLFVVIEIGVLLILLQKYCPLDINNINAKIVNSIV